MMGEIYEGRHTQQAIERFRPIIKRGLNQYINDSINETLKSAIKNQSDAEDSNKYENQPEQVTSPIDPQVKEKIITTQEELEAFGIIKGLLHDVLDPSMISYKDTEYYFGVLYDNKTTKWICRLKLDGRKKTIIIPAIVEQPYDKETKHSLKSINDLHNFKDILGLSAKRFKTPDFE